MQDNQRPGGQPQGDPWGGQQQHSQNQNDWGNQQQHHAQGHHQQRQQQRGQRGSGTISSALGPGDTAAADAIPEERMGFIRRTYAWVTGMIVLCAAMMVAFFASPFSEPVVHFMLGTSWLLVLALFIGFSWLGDWMAHRVDSKGLQIIGMFVGVGAYALIFSYLFVASGIVYPSGDLVPGVAGDATELVLQAGGLTLAVFGVLTGIVFVTKQDFSVLRTGLIVMSVLALGAIGAAAIFGFTLGLGFVVAMIGFCAALIIYQTSNILHHYPTDRHVGAALALFSSIGMMFWYLFILLGFDG